MSYIRHADLSDLDLVTEVENTCFPPQEAASREVFADRLKTYPKHFWLYFEDTPEGCRLVSFVDGMVTDEPDLKDCMYASASLHNEKGAWQMIFGVNTLPAFRRQGFAGRLLCEAIAQAQRENRRGLVLTCKDALVHYYAYFGFEDEGISDSAHGNATWHQMRLTF